VCDPNKVPGAKNNLLGWKYVQKSEKNLAEVDVHLPGAQQITGANWFAANDDHKP
jgi:hypothetical protein